ncbi:lipopolysaccharide biosynthesis protein [Desulfococcus multivorans]|uniref:Polysaccharide biosynthesis protein n=1 Tax=Desulfococcus multivorans DSM 2059 TaxID=1121405 RepID=S7TC21_DESML|nr:lipopolysaccharide biosynthesis protein [Desulfococcus multivorans]AOY60121.1 putative polysaccharide biosynthesis protein [Desulfococcus multivorans]AQV02256.1 hypothetical protein B2D07_16780 [Desulfococcus multivorans]EPR34090.1 hypothetical protein dsmv_3431 [Desulfococcus multivorans DSM 2059]SKA27433.1 Membrane protein involved in the export of O-antigen and teichoic acid [Desulfococcus multivorans DSM 2059]
MTFTIALKDNPLIRRIGKNFSIGFVGSVLLLIFSLLRTTLLTKNLPIADYGRILVVMNFFSFMAMLFGLRVNDFIYRFYPQFNNRLGHNELKGIVFISFILSFTVGFVIAVGTYMSAYWVAEIFYKDPSYAPLFRIFAIAAFFIAFEGFYSSILRLHDRFILIILPQITGAAFSLGIIAYQLVYAGSVTIKLAIWAITAGMLITALSALLFSILCILPLLRCTKGTGIRSLKKHRRNIFSTLFQTNLTGYLKLGSDTGGMFLLGILATPNQVALYGIARQLAKVLQVVQNNVQNALTPEIVSLWAQQKIKQLYELINAYSKISLISGAIIACVAAIVSKPIILAFTTPDYLNALPVFYVFIFTIYMTFVSLVFFPLALAMNQMARRNLVVSIRFVYLLIGIILGLNAMMLAMVELFGALTTRLLNDIPLLRNLRRIYNTEL